MNNKPILDDLLGLRKHVHYTQLSLKAT